MSSDTPDKSREESPKKHRKELGKSIASIRKEKNYSLEALSEKTKVPLEALKNIEEGHEDFYKEKLYSKGFLSLICRELKIDPKPFLEKMKACEEPNIQPSKNILEKESFSQVKMLKTRKMFSFKSFFLSLLIILLSFGYYFYSKNIETNSFKHQAEPSKKTVLQSSKKNQNCLRHKPTEFQNVKNVSCLSLMIKDQTSITSKYDSQSTQKISYKKGLYHFYYTNSLDFVFHNASQVELILEGKNQGVLSEKKEEKKLSFLTKKEISPST